MGAGLGDVSRKAMLGTTGEFAAYQNTALPGVDPSDVPDL